MRATSIRTRLLLTVSALTLLIALLITGEVYRQWQRLEKIQDLKQATLASDPLFDVTERLSVERDIAYSLLFTQDNALIQSLRPRLESSRQDADKALSATLQTLQQYSFPELGKQIRKGQEQLASLQLLRRRIEASMSLPVSARDPALARQWFDGVTALILQTQDIWLEFIKHFNEVDPIVSLQMRFKYDLRAITEYGGRERALIGRLIVQNADASPEDQANLLRWQGAVKEAWDAADTLAEQGKLYPAIKLTFREAKSHYANVYGMVHDIFYIPGARHGKNYPITADFWFELAGEITDSLYALKNAALRETHSYLDVLEAKARQAILMYLALMVCVLVLCTFSFRVITGRVIRPINAMVAALLDTMQGKRTPILPPAATADDEIGKLAQVLYAFQRNAEQIRRAAAELQESRERYRALVESSSQIVWTWKEGVLEKNSPLSQWWEEVTGQSSEAIATFGWLDVVHPDDRAQAKKIWEDAFTLGKNFELEYRLRKRNGEYCHASVRGVAIKNADGSLNEFIGSLNDITERKEAQEKLLRYTRDLERSNQELDDFAYIASHDLKEPLRGLFNNAKFLQDDYRDKLDAEGVGRLVRLGYLCQRMETLVNDLLYFSRLGRQELAIQLTDLNQVIHDIGSMTETSLKESHASIRVPRPLPTIICDKPRITEALRNLISNAIKYNNNPEKLVEIGCLDAVQTKQGLEHRVFYVHDNGIGIEEEFFDEIFRIFKRLNEEDDQRKGTGVGLTFVKKIIERHGGRIWVESEPGKGTTFYFTINQGAAYANAA